MRRILDAAHRYVNRAESERFSSGYGVRAGDRRPKKTSHLSESPKRAARHTGDFAWSPPDLPVWDHVFRTRHGLIYRTVSVRTLRSGGGVQEDDPLAKLISFDIDGTLEIGDPPGILTMDLVRKAQSLGYLIGSCSDRPVNSQVRLWGEHRISVDFTVLKQNLEEVKAQFKVEAYFHVGDTEIDRFFADQAGFQFIQAEAGAWQAALPDLPLSLGRTNCQSPSE